MKSQILAFAVYCLVWLPVDAQVNTSTFKFNKVDKPLKQNGVSSITQDSHGYLWIGTIGGLHRFDGMEFEIYEGSSDSSSISHSEVWSMHEDGEGNLWIGTIKGLCRYDRERNNFVRYELLSANTLNNDEINPEITSIVEAGDGTLWVANVREGLFYKPPGKDEFIEYDPEVIDTKNITALHLIRDSILWIGSLDQGLTRLNLDSKRKTKFIYNPQSDAGLSMTSVRTITSDRQGNIYLGGFYGIHRLAPGDTVFTKFELNNAEIKRLYLDSRNRLWACGINSGLFLLDKSSDEFVLFENDPNNPTSIQSNTFWDMYEDRENRIWLGSTLDGLIVLDEYLSQFDLYDNDGDAKGMLSNDNIRFFMEDDKENLWIATDGGGLNYFDRQTNQYRQIRNIDGQANSLGSDAVLTIAEDHNGNLWVGTWNGGVSIIDPSTFEVDQFKKDNEDLDRVLHIAKTREGTLWFATIDGGISHYDPNSDKLTTYKHDINDNHSIINNRVRYIYEDLDQNIWVGTNGAGLDLIKREDISIGKFTHLSYDISDPDKLPSGKINHIIEDTANNLWIATEKGISRYKRETQTFESFKLEGKHFLAASMAEDEKGLLWIGSSPGLVRFNPTDNTFRLYGGEDGVQPGEFSRYCVTKTKKGEMVFGGENGFNIFFPDSIKDNNHPPEVYITGLRVFNKTVEIGAEDGILPVDISLLDEITLSHRHSVFTLDFIGINYTSPEKNSYAYRLEGLEEEWNYVDNRRSTTYTNLDPGDYVFHVKAANNHDLWNEVGRSIIIHVLPPWWKTWWALVLWAILVSGSLLFLYKIRIAELKQQHDKLEDLVDERTEDLNKRSRELEMANEELKAYDQMVSHDLKGPLNNVNMLAQLLMNDDSSNFSAEGKKMMNSLYEMSKTAKDMTDEILTFASSDKPQNLDTQVDVGKQVKKAVSAHTLTIQYKNALVESDLNGLSVPGVAIKIYQLFYNLIGNALKFQGDDSQPVVRIYSIELEGVKEIIVEDNGIGFDSSEIDVFQPFQRSSNSKEFSGYGIGLGTCQRIIDYHGWKIRAESEIGKGSKFIITLV